MLEIKLPYSQEISKILGPVSRPITTIKVYSNIENTWMPVYNTLLDTGADITLIPKYLGEMLVGDITTGIYVEIKGIVPNAHLIGFIHTLRLEVFNKEFETKVVIAKSDDTRPVLGRFNCLDLFEVTFDKGKQVIVN